MNDFFNLEKFQCFDSQIVAQISFNESHAIFGSHFPNHPVVPGVCTIAITKILFEKGLGLNLILTKAPTIKYRKMLVPTSIAILEMNWKKNEEFDEFILNCTWKIESEIAFSLFAYYQII